MRPMLKMSMRDVGNRRLNTVQRSGSPHVSTFESGDLVSRQKEGVHMFAIPYVIASRFGRHELSRKVGHTYDY